MLSFTLENTHATPCSNAFGAKYKTLEILKEFVGEDSRAEYPVKYLSDDDRDFLVIQFKEGRLIDSDGEFISLNYALYVMSPDGKIFVHPADFTTRHSGLIAGAPVAGAGHMTVIEGQVTYLDNFSGHYQPKAEHLEQVISELRSQNVDLSKTEFFLRGVGTLNK